MNRFDVPLARTYAGATSAAGPLIFVRSTRKATLGEWVRIECAGQEGRRGQVIDAGGRATVVAGGGSGSRGVRSTGRAAVVDEFSNVKIEVITANRETANHIADEVARKFFDNYSGITYFEDVEILRPEKF